MDENATNAQDDAWVNQLRIHLTNKTYLGFPDQWEYRVFVGGAYAQASLGNLFAIKDAIRRRDLRYVPLMGSDVYMREKRYSPSYSSASSYL